MKLSTVILLSAAKQTQLLNLPSIQISSLDKNLAYLWATLNVDEWSRVGSLEAFDSALDITLLCFSPSATIRWREWANSWVFHSQRQDQHIPLWVHCCFFAYHYCGFQWVYPWCTYLFTRCDLVMWLVGDSESDTDDMVPEEPLSDETGQKNRYSSSFLFEEKTDSLCIDHCRYELSLYLLSVQLSVHT